MSSIEKHFLLAGVSSGLLFPPNLHSMKSLLFAVSLLLAATFAQASKPVTSISAALAKAKSENKLLFLQLGREDCPHCQALRAMIKSQKVSLPEEKFVYADVNCDDRPTMKAFVSRFQVRGNELPFVVIAAPDGTQLVARSGEGSEKDYNKLVRRAEKASRK